MASSSGVVTESSTASALAPVYVAVTVTTGGAMRGNCAIGKVGMHTRPARVTMIDATAAKIGRLRKNSITRGAPCPY